MRLFSAIAEEKLAGLPLIRLRRSLDWRSIRESVAFLYDEINARKGGQNPYDPLCMARVLLLQKWHGLSDPKTEIALIVRVDFALFAGLEDDTPDATTISRFRTRLKKAGKLEELFQLAERSITSTGWQVIPTADAIRNIRLKKCHPVSPDILEFSSLS